MSVGLRRWGTLAVLVGLCIACVAFASRLRADSSARPLVSSAGQAAVNAAATIPPGPEGELIQYGRDLITHTPKLAGSYVTARMSCAACHLNAGTQAHAGSLVGTYATFPQWNKRAKRFIALQDRLAECFLYSMNGKPPAYESRAMVALTAYIAWLSRGAPTGVGFPDQGPIKVAASLPPSVGRGQGIYLDRCLGCHRADGNGVGLTYPPLWGPHSFNDKAGMSRMDRMVPFVKFAMPANAPGTLTDQEATDVAAFILSRPRPHFDKNRLVQFPPDKAGYF